MTRTAAVARALAHFDTGAFLRDLDRRVAFHTESQEPAQAPALAAYLEDVFTIPVNLAGLPGISVPCGSVEVEGKSLPVGLQIVGKALDEASVLRVAHAYEQSR